MDISTQTEHEANSLGYFLEEIERPVQIARQTYIPQLLKDLLCSETIFLDRFGIASQELEELHDILEAKLLRYQTIIPENLWTKNCVALTLRFLASGLTMQELGRQYNISYSKILRIIRIVTKTMANHLVPLVMPTPSEHMWEKTAEDFRNKYNMPNCIGAIEGKNLFVNGKRIVFLAIVDAHHRFIMVDLGYYRKNLFRGDVMANSIIGKLFMKNLFRVPESKPIAENSEPVPFMILGSSLFPSKPYLMTKYSRPECASNELNRVFNTRISRAKLTVNRALLHLRHRWRVFQGPLPVPSYLVERIVVSCCCLQNFFAIRDDDLLTPEPPDPYAMLSNEKLDSLKRLLPEDSRDVRTKFKRYFLSPEGQVPWQWQDIL